MATHTFQFSWYLFALLTVAPFLRTQSIMMGFWFILVTSIIVTWPSSFSGHRFKLESKDFIFHILQRNFSNFGMKILVRCSAKSPEFLFFLILLSSGIYWFKVWLKSSQNGYIFFFFYTQVA